MMNPMHKSLTIAILAVFIFLSNNNEHIWTHRLKKNMDFGGCNMKAA